MNDESSSDAEGIAPQRTWLRRAGVVVIVCVSSPPAVVWSLLRHGPVDAWDCVREIPQLLMIGWREAATKKEKFWW